MSSIQDKICARRRQILEKRLEDLFSDLGKVMQQMGYTLSEVEKEHLERQKKSIDLEIDSTAAQLEALERECRRAAAPPDFNRVYLDLMSQLPAIDFKVLEEIIRKILRDHRDEGWAALLFQESESMGGEWCAARIRELLRRETGAGQFHPIPVGFTGKEEADRITLLSRIGQYLHIESSGQDPQSFSKLVVQKLCSSLRSGSVVMIECKSCDYLFLDPEIFCWVVEDFWRPLVLELERVAEQYYAIKVLLLLFVDGRLQERCLVADHCCTLEAFKKEKLLEIPLEVWSREDIKEWIACYSGLPRSRVDIIANKVYGSTQGGLPSLVVNALLKEFCP